MRLALAALALMIAAVPAWAAPQDVVALTMGKPSGEGPFDANFAVRNLTDHLLKSIHVKCAALNG